MTGTDASKACAANCAVHALIIIQFYLLSAEILSAENQAEKAGNRTEKIFKENDETRSYSYGNISALSIGKLNCDCGFAESV